MYAGPLTLLGILGFVAFLIWIVHRGRLEKRRLLLEEQNKLLDRIGSGDSLAAFLKTEHGQAILSRLNGTEGEDQNPHTAYQRGIVGLLTAGVICLSLGLSLVPVAILVEWDVLIPAFVVTGVGLGCLLAAWIQAVLGNRWASAQGLREKARTERVRS
jgi:hypothetical protein